jgi:hypothetical protein
MKSQEYYRLRNHPVLGSTAANGNNGFFVFPHYRIVNYELRCQVSDGEGWEHVSVTAAPKGQKTSRCPTWEEMCWVKNQFWTNDEVVVQYHPRETDYVNMHPHCLHLWKPTEIELPTPNPLMVGVNL